MDVFIGFQVDFSASREQFKECGETPAGREHTNRFQDCSLSDAVFSGNQGHTPETRDRQIVNPSKSFDFQIRKVKWIAHCVLHPSGTKALTDFLIVPLRSRVVAICAQRRDVVAPSTSFDTVHTIV